MKSICILGLAGKQSNQNIKTADELWTLNDWYRVYPHIANPARVYQIHGDFKGDHLPGRYINWKDEYNRSGAEIVTVQPLGLNNERIFDHIKAVNEFGLLFFKSTMTYMLIEAMWEGVDRIYLEGIDLIGDEFLQQVPNMIECIDLCRERGIEVITNKYDEWQDKMTRIPSGRLDSFSSADYSWFPSTDKPLKMDMVNGI